MLDVDIDDEDIPPQIPFPDLPEKLTAAQQFLDYCLQVEVAQSEGDISRGLEQLETEAKDAALRLLTRVFDSEKPHKVE